MRIGLGASDVMRKSTRWMSRSGLAVLGAVLLAAGHAQAQDAEYQNFFTSICAGGNASANLATLCAATPGGGGNISGDSENSLNPAQSLTSANYALARAKDQTKKSQERAEELRQEARGGPAAGYSSGQEGGFEFGGFSLLINIRGETFERDRDASDEELGYDGDAGAIEIGLDYRLSDRLVVGGLLGYQRTESDFDADAPGNNFTPTGDQGGTDVDNVSLTLFGSYNITDQLYVEGTLGAGISDYEFRRNAIFQESTRTVAQTTMRARGDSEGVEYSASAGIGYDFYRDAWSFGPYLKLNYSHSKVDGYTETDSANTGLAMRIGDNDRTSLTSVLGVQGSYAISTNFGVLVPQARIEYEHEFDNDPSTVTQSFVQDTGGTVLSLRGDSPDRDYFNVGASLVLILPNGWIPFLDLEALAGYDDLQRRRLTAGMRVEF